MSSEPVAEWEATRLKAILTLRAGGAFSRELQGRVTGDHPFIKVSDLSRSGNERFIQFAGNWVDESDAAALKTKTMPSGSIVFAKIGEGLKANRLRVLTRPTYIDNNMMAAIGDPTVVDPGFLLYLLIEAKLFRFAGGSALPFLRQSDLYEVEVLLPSLPEQRRIRGVLGALDEKVRHSQAMAARCRQICVLLFEHTFGHAWPAAFHSGRTPSGGEWGVVADLASLKYGKALTAADRRGGDVRVVGSSGVVGRHDVALAEGPAVVVGRKGTAGSVLWIDDSIWPIDTTFFATPVEGIGLEYMYYALRAADLPSLTADSAVPGLNRDAAMQQAVVIPECVSAEAFADATRPLHALAAACDRQADRVTAIRDALLPKLISGKARVSHAYLADLDEPGVWE